MNHHSPQKRVLITGAGQGLGESLCETINMLGHYVIATGRDRKAVERVAKKIGGDTEAKTLDVTDPESIRRCRKAVGDVDIVINNAGVLLDGEDSPSDMPLALVKKSLNINAWGAWRVSHEFLPGMRKQGWGRIVMVSSGAASFGYGLFTGAPGYSISKVALNAITVLLASEVRSEGILVNAVNPGRVRTRMYPEAEQAPEEAAQDIAAVATLPDNGPTGSFLRRGQIIPW